jgi:hypothetical protein
MTVRPAKQLRELHARTGGDFIIPLLFVRQFEYAAIRLQARLRSMSQKPKFNYLLGTSSAGVQKMILLILWSMCICVQAQDTNQAQVVSGLDFQIVIQSVERQGTFEGRPLYKLSYRFDFHKRDQIFLKDFGNIEAQGELSYLTLSKVVEFWSRDRKDKLTTVEFQETASPKGEPDELPSLKEFLHVKRESPWPVNLPAQLNILKVVNKYYPTGAHPWIEHDTQYFETVYKPLGSLRRGILGRVALLISFPTVPNSDPYNIDIQAAIQERRRLEDWRNDSISPETSSSAEAFLAFFAAELEKASGSQ